MINTHLKFEAKIPNGSKVVALTRSYTKFLILKGKFEGKIPTVQTMLHSQGIT